MEDQEELFTLEEKKLSHEIEQSICALFHDLEEKNLLTPMEKAKRAMLMKTAKALDIGLSQSKISIATANLLTKTLEAMETLPRATATNDSMDAWDAAILDETAAAMKAEAQEEDDLVPVDPWRVNP